MEMSSTAAAAWILAVLLVGLGFAGVLIPTLPGTVFVFAGLALAAWSDHFERVGLATVGVLGALTVLSYVVEFGASLLGAKRFGASRPAVLGAALGTVVGIFFGLPGILIGPFAGAVLGEYGHRRDLGQAGRVGLGAWIGFALGLAGKLAIACTMVGLFVAAWLW
jgi:uncharacterized protein YqgC (DUF456 family)